MKELLTWKVVASAIVVFIAIVIGILSMNCGLN